MTERLSHIDMFAILGRIQVIAELHGTAVSLIKLTYMTFVQRLRVDFGLVLQIKIW